MIVGVSYFFERANRLITGLRESSAWRGSATGLSGGLCCGGGDSERRCVRLERPAQAVLGAVGMIQQPGTLCCSNRLLEELAGFSEGGVIRCLRGSTCLA
jgi:hypothetical protein